MKLHARYNIRNASYMDDIDTKSTKQRGAGGIYSIRGFRRRTSYQAFSRFKNSIFTDSCISVIIFLYNSIKLEFKKPDRMAVVLLLLSRLGRPAGGSFAYPTVPIRY